ncbi:hypothetical protein JAAARDRAFT_538784 [Jaapia argillacea MUCL 33604]|uniref:F-box domain-containing protein n=1 Tax=Jaapia argillacea MUCL 33604 TaxID=933084 RepID=A0A067P8P7_9AGAM|nr:hypothetical protein JAAARDRAFT_538784 [Jaapia argillacea MUCL 33604]
MDPGGECSDSIISSDASTLVDSASFVSMDGSNAVTLRSLSVEPTHSSSQETITDFKSKRREGKPGAGKRVLSFFGGGKGDNPGNHSGSKASGSDTSLRLFPWSSQSLTDDLLYSQSSELPKDVRSRIVSKLPPIVLLSCLHNSHPLRDAALSLLIHRFSFRRYPGQTLDLNDLAYPRTCLEVSSPLNFSGIEVLSRTSHFPLIGGINATFYRENALKLRDLSRFVAKLTVVNEVGIYFYSNPFHVFPPEWSGTITSECLLDFLDALHGEQCTRFWSAQPAQNFISFFSITPTSSSRICRARPLHTLEDVSISASIYLLPPIQDWSIRTMNLSPITSLFLHCADLPPSAWTSVLSQVTIRSLKALSIQGTVPYLDLIDFLNRHSNITILYLNHCNPDHPSVHDGEPHLLDGPVLPDGFLPNLIYLTGPPECHLHFLKNRKPSTFPHLATFCIFPTDTSAPRRCQGYPFLTNLSPHVLGYTSLANDALEHIQSLPYDCSVTIVVGCKECVDWLLRQRRGGEVEIGLGDDAVKGGVTGILLALRGDAWLSEGDMMTLLPAWLSTFPSLSRFSFESLGPSVDFEDRLLEAILEACPNIPFLQNSHTQKSVTRMTGK